MKLSAQRICICGRHNSKRKPMFSLLMLPEKQSVERFAFPLIYMRCALRFIAAASNGSVTVGAAWHQWRFPVRKNVPRGGLCMRTPDRCPCCRLHSYTLPTAAYTADFSTALHLNSSPRRCFEARRYLPNEVRLTYRCEAEAAGACLRGELLQGRRTETGGT